MKKILCTALVSVLFSHSALADTDREQIKAAMECFYQWDLYGGSKNSSKCIADNVQYHRVDQDGKHAHGTPPLNGDGKGADVVIHNLIDIDIYNNMAVVTSLHRYTPESPENTYMKNIVLYKLAEGWKVSSVSWGRVMNDQ